MSRLPPHQRKVPGRAPTPRALPPAERAPASASSQPRGSQSAAISLVLDSIPAGEGGRIIPLGASGKGKTYFGVRLVRELQRRRLCSTAVILDLKDPERPQYEGKLVHSLDEARRALCADAGAPPFLVCRPGVTAQEAASLVQEAAECGDRLAFFADELTPCLRVNEDTLEPQRQIFAGPSLPWLQLQGRGLGASSILLVQLPSHVPSSALDNATAYPCFGMGGRSLAYSLDLRIVPKEAASVVAKLERGQLCVFFPDREWDGIVYGPE